MKPILRRDALLFALFSCFVSFLLGLTARAEIPTRLEPFYAEAVLAYNTSDYNRTLTLLDALQKQIPTSSEVLELKALTLKATRSEKTPEAYRELIRIKTAERRTRREIAPYYFELGSLAFEKKHWDEAASAFEHSATWDFNVGASNFFLGLIAFQKNDWEKAGQHFNQVVLSNADSLKPPAHFYLAQVYSKTNNGSASTHEFQQAKESSKTILDNEEATDENKKIAQQIYDASTKALAPLAQGRWFSNIALLTGYDSNVLALPDTLTGASASGKATPKETAQLGLGYASSALRSYQVIPSYRLNYNYNTNKDSRTGEYLIQTLSTYITRHPLDTTTYGLKIEATHTFQNNVDATTDSSTYRPLSLNFSVGPSVRKQLKPNLIAGAEFLFEPQHYYTDDQQATNTKLSGTQIQLRGYLQFDRAHRYWNPSVGLDLLKNDTDGLDYASKVIALSFANAFYLDKTKLNATLDISLNKFDDRTSGARKDQMYSFGLSGSHPLNDRLSFIADGHYIINNSNIVDTYQYKRFMIEAGISYSIF